MQESDSGHVGGLLKSRIWPILETYTDNLIKLDAPLITEVDANDKSTFETYLVKEADPLNATLLTLKLWEKLRSPQTVKLRGELGGPPTAIPRALSDCAQAIIRELGRYARENGIEANTFSSPETAEDRRKFSEWLNSKDRKHDDSYEVEAFQNAEFAALINDNQHADFLNIMMGASSLLLTRVFATRLANEKK